MLHGGCGAKEVIFVKQTLTNYAHYAYIHRVIIFPLTNFFKLEIFLQFRTLQITIHKILYLK
jgi:hypothetical protein